jgi:hypothetical protein
MDSLLSDCLPVDWLLPNQVAQILIVLTTDELLNLFVWSEVCDLFCDPWLGICRWVIYRRLNLQVPQVRSPKFFDNTQPFRPGMSGAIKPTPIVVSDGFHNQRIPTPAPDRMALPGRI